MADEQLRHVGKEGKGEMWANSLRQLKNSIQRVEFLKNLLGEIVYQAGSGIATDERQAVGFALQFEGAAALLDNVLEGMDWRQECAGDATTIAEAKAGLDVLGCCIRMHGVLHHMDKWGGLEILTSGLADKLLAVFDNMTALGYPEEKQEADQGQEPGGEGQEAKSLENYEAMSNQEAAILVAGRARDLIFAGGVWADRLRAAIEPIILEADAAGVVA